MTRQELLFLEQSNAIEAVYDAASLLDAIDAWKYIKKQRTLTPENIKQTHKILMKNLLKDAGYFRRQPVWIGGREGKPFYVIQELIEQWCQELSELVQGARDSKKDEERVKEFHVRYERIHPFIDGNGRTGRMFYNWHRLRFGLPLHVIKNDERFDYYKWFSEKL